VGQPAAGCDQAVLSMYDVHVKVRDGQVTNRPFYVAIGVSVDGHRDIFGIWAGGGAGEGAEYWLRVAHRD
jgi:putative transposase